VKTKDTSEEARDAFTETTRRQEKEKEIKKMGMRTEVKKLNTKTKKRRKEERKKGSNMLTYKKH